MIRLNPTSLFVLLILLLHLLLDRCFCVAASQIDLTVEIQPGTKECFWQTFPETVVVKVDYQVIDGGDMDIDVIIAGPENRVYHVDQRKTENVMSFKTANAGDYQVCFDNSFSHISHKIVYFEIAAEDGKEKDLADGTMPTFEWDNIQGLLDMTLQDFMGILDRSKKHLEDTIQAQTLIRVHEAKDRNIQEANFSLVNFFSCVQLVLMVAVSLAQVLTIRNLFLEKKPISGTTLKSRT